MDPAAHSLTVVIPCYNEAERLDEAPLLAFLDGCAEASVLFVNDGSTDATADRLAAIAAARPARIDVLSLQPNGGKAEAVRRGMLAALERGAGVIGYLDADLSTPPREIPTIPAHGAKSDATRPARAAPERSSSIATGGLDDSGRRPMKRAFRQRCRRLIRRRHSE